MPRLWDRLRARRTALRDMALDRGEPRSQINAAYDEGRRDESARHHSHPIVSLALFLVAVVGAVVVFYAVLEGSFTRGGAALGTVGQAAADKTRAIADKASKPNS